MTEARRPGQPERIGRYRVLQRIGKGGMGVVYSAHDDVMDRDVAIKVMMADPEIEPDLKTRFLREAQVSARLAHRNIVTVFDIGEDNGRFFIVMELLHGETLGEAMRGRALALEQKVDMIVDVCDGLGAANAAGVCHRDVKPGNLFVLADGGVKILDFGIARLESSSMTVSGALIGTPHYMAPEQARGTTTDERSDIFSVGAVFYEMLAGRKPFAASTPDPYAVIHKVIAEDPPPLTPDEAPPLLTRVLFKAMAKEPADRYQHFAEFSADLAKWRRRYDLETRTLAADAARRMAQLPALANEERSCAAALGMEPEADDARWQSEIAAGYPVLATGGADALKTAVWTRQAVDLIGARISGIAAAAEARLSTLRAAVGTLVVAQASLAQSDGEAAMAALRRVEQAVPTAALKPLIDQAGDLIAKRRAREDRVRVLLEDAATAKSAGRIEAAIALTREVVELEPENAGAAQLLARLEQERVAADADRVRRCERALERSRRAIQVGELDEAERQVALAEEAGVSSSDVAAVRARLAQAKSARDDAEAQIQEIAAGLSQARTAFEAGERAAAVQQLEDLAARYPASPALKAELERLRSLHKRHLDAETSALDADRLAAQAAEALARDDLDTALATSEQALALVPGHAQALRVAALSSARRRERAEQADRAERARRVIDGARDLMERGKYERAMKEARRGAELDPSNADASAVIAEAVRRQRAAAAAEQQNKEAALRSAELRDLLDGSEKALHAGDFVRARRLAEQAVAIDASSPAPRALIRQIASAAIAAQEHDDATRPLGTIGIDPDKTVPVDRQESRIRRRAVILRAWLVVVWAGAIAWFRHRLERSTTGPTELPPRPDAGGEKP